MKFLLFLILTSLSLCFQNSSASIREYKLDDIRVIICDDFFLPIAKVGVFYSVGINQLRNICEAEMIEETFLSATSKRSAKKLGTNINFSIHGSFSEVSAIVSSEQIPDVIKIIMNNKIDIKNLLSTKNKIRIRHKLSDYFETNFVDKEIYAGIDSKYIFNESILDYITENDLKNSLDKYEKAHLDIIICGKLNTKQLIEKFNLKQLSPNDENANTNTNQAEIKATNFSGKTIQAKSKFFGRSLYYIYQINTPELRKKQDAIFAILSHETFNYFKKYSQLIDNFFITNLMKPNRVLFGFKLKGDVSKKSFEINLKNFFSHIKKVEFSHEKSKLISKLEKFSEINIDEDIHAKYQTIKNRYILHSQTQNDISEDILSTSSNDIRNFIEQVIENNPVAKISTQYKMEN